MTQEYKVIHYIEGDRDIFLEWLENLKDIRGLNAVRKVIDRVKSGNFGDNHYCRDGVWEFRIKLSPGYRVYYSISGKKIILLLCGGSKQTQDRDIDKAVEYLKKYKEEHKW
ncbi:MAG: type II toxin-antitoxin system RelE/ParE family toxin [Synergistaceae bacterium]|nr:type II toxin-antitoxin system RelE/ParE family toxin [Synergistaceae bacterium]